MSDEFYATPWPGLAVWVVLYVSDFLFTMTCARLYQNGVRDRIVFEGSYELNPVHQRDVDAVRWMSPRFLVALVASTTLLWLLWWMSIQYSDPTGYLFLLGAMVLTELVIHVRHLRNLFLFRAVIRGDAVRGRIEYDRPLLLRLSSIELLACAGLLTVVYLVTGSWFVLGGAFSCTATGINHLILSRRWRASDRGVRS